MQVGGAKRPSCSLLKAMMTHRCGLQSVYILRDATSAGAVQEQEQSGEQSRMRTLGTAELLRQMPVLQRLLGRLMDCRPTGAAAQDPVVQVHCHSQSFSRTVPRLIIASYDIDLQFPVLMKSSSPGLCAGVIKRCRA